MSTATKKQQIRILEPDEVLPARPEPRASVPVAVTAKDVLPSVGAGLAVLALGVLLNWRERADEPLQDPPPARRRVRTQRWRNI